MWLNMKGMKCMKKVLMILLCVMCILVVGCQKSDNEIINGKASGELENKDSGEDTIKSADANEKFSNILVENLFDENDFRSFYKNTNYLNEKNIVLFAKEYYSNGQNNSISLKFLECPDFNLASHEFELTINDKSIKVYCDIELCGIYVVDLNDNDLYKEIAIVKPSGRETYLVEFYRFTENQIIDLGGLDNGAFSGIDTILKTNDRIFSISDAVKFKDEVLYLRYYITNENEITKENVNIDLIKGTQHVISADTINEDISSEGLTELEKETLLEEKVEILDYTLTDSLVSLEVKDKNGNIYSIGHAVGSQV